MNLSGSKKEKGVTWSEWLFEMYDGIMLFYALLYEFPKYIYDTLKIDKLLGASTATGAACCCCFCGALFIVILSIGIALGVGLGVGLNCENKQPISNNITTSTIISFVNSTIGSTTIPTSILATST